MKTCIIIGAGPAGLSAAHQLLKDGGVHPVILEATDAIGGISQTVTYKKNRIDIGGHRFFTKSQDVRNLWLELMPLQGAPSLDELMLNKHPVHHPGGPDPEKTDRVMLERKRVSRIFYLRKFFDYPISLSLQTLKKLGIGRIFIIGCSYLTGCVFKRTEKSLEDFYCNRFGRKLYQMFFEDYTEKLWGVHPSEIAPDWGSQRVKGLSISKAIYAIFQKKFSKNRKVVETSLIDSFWYPAKGPGAFYETMAKAVVDMGGEIVMNAEVCGIESDGASITGVSYKKDGEVFHVTGDSIISSMPIKDLIAAMGEVVPEPVRKVALALPYRDFMTVGLLLKRLNIKNDTTIRKVNNLIPDCWIYIQEREVKLGRIQIFNNWSPYMVDNFAETVWIGLEYFCAEGDELWSMSDASFIDFAVDELCKIGVIDRADVLDAVRIRIKKAYPAYFGSYSRFSEVKEYLSGIDNLFPVGRNGQHRYNNMDHSMLTGIRAAQAVAGKIDRNAVWEVNTEEDYHEQTK